MRLVEFVFDIMSLKRRKVALLLDVINNGKHHPREASYHCSTLSIWDAAGGHCYPGGLLPNWSVQDPAMERLQQLLQLGPRENTNAREYRTHRRIMKKHRSTNFLEISQEWNENGIHVSRRTPFR